MSIDSGVKKFGIVAAGQLGQMGPKVCSSEWWIAQMDRLEILNLRTAYHDERVS